MKILSGACQSHTSMRGEEGNDCFIMKSVVNVWDKITVFGNRTILSLETLSRVYCECIESLLKH